MEEVPVRVAVRVRPLVGQEKTHNVPKCITFVPDKPQLILGKDKAFTFDYVFQPSVSQSEVYKTCVEPLVKSCFDGYNATVFAYGQTGSGKTYTVGSSNTAELLDDEYGIIPRALEQIFQVIEEQREKVHFVVSASYIEIYMEEMRDLLDLETSTKDIHIREDEQGNTVITGATEQVVESADEALSCLDAGAAGRHVGSTNMNEHSSRSHAIFTLYIEQHMIQGEEKEQKDNLIVAEYSQFMSAKFHFVDLAGSERAHRTGNVGERFKESVHINSGLLALGNVISALSDCKKKPSHIPYRDSKITRILKDSLGGNARTVMLTCLSPAAADLAENLNSLKYATRARNIKNKPIVNRDPQAAMLAEMQDEIQALREELQRTRARTLESVSDVGDVSKIREAVEELERTQHDLEVVRSLLDEATSLLNEVYKANGMNRTLAHQYEQLKKRVEKFKKELLKTPRSGTGQKNQNEIVDGLKKELEKYKKELAADSEIFAERTKESDSLRDHIKELQEENLNLNEQLKDVSEKLKKHDDQLLRQQVQLNKQTTSKENGIIEDEAEEKIAKKSSNDLPEENKRGSLTSSAGKNVLDRMMQNFRARSDLLVGQYEEEDEVQHSLSDTSDSDQEEKTGKEKHVATPSKTLGKTWNAKGKAGVSGNKKITTKVRQVGTLSSPVTKNTQSTIRKRSEIAKEEKSKKPAESEIQNLRMSTQVVQTQVHESEKRLREAQRQLRDLTINIKLKQELIKELVRSDKEANLMKKTFAEKVEEMQREVEKKKKDLENTQKTLAQYEVKSHQEQNEKQKLEQEYKRKLQTLEEQLHELKKKQKDNEKVSILYDERERKLSELEQHLDKMKVQQHNLQKRLRDETDKKIKMEREFQKDQQRIKELEEKNFQNEKILKRKTEEVAAAQRKLRRKGSKEERCEETSKFDERRQWLDNELEEILSKKQAMETLQEELAKREEILKQREQMVREKSELQMKKLRSSQVLSKDILRMSTQLDTVEEQLREKDTELRESEDERTSENIRQDIEVLEIKRSELLKQREGLDAKLKEGSLLNVEEERRLLEFDEGIDALEAAIEFKTDSINTKKKKLRVENAENTQNDLVAKLNSLGREDAIFLLSKYFEKVVSHRENERRQQMKCDDLTLRVDEQDRVIRELERGYKQADLRAERRLTDQAKEYEHRVQFLMKQVNDMEKHTSDKESRILELEKDLYYYKKVSRDLKKKLREMAGKDGVLDSMQTASVQSDAPPDAEPGFSVEMKSHDQKRGNKLNDGNLKNVLDKVAGSQPSTPVRVSRKDLRELSEKEVSVRKTQPSSRPDVAASGVARKSSADRVPLVQQSQRSSKRDPESVQASSLQDSIEQSGNPWT